jgi:hypothetical protein
VGLGTSGARCLSGAAEWRLLDPQRALGTANDSRLLVRSRRGNLSRLLISGTLLFLALAGADYCWWRTCEYAEALVTWLEAHPTLVAVPTPASPSHRSLP